ncbi:GumC family protein [Scleromatobacter humisilvae]|uniref:Wzz/FepE/Etk N-terminal domain-containing protein n=1 Tax=Scleromatobacter humisilvae TaxID=2897159 RepID=A0A9X1YNS0_9BURK|nr:Wzz/FepE/Etk N-terminal domain-containing protein [Scleromatobacter humisilvae]MCK9688345.1 Wzz/FepE/Etk N-terminal domain-containing protein [Scleromatobacter humisilvae]
MADHDQSLPEGESELSLQEFLRPISQRWRMLLAAPFVFGAIGAGVSYLITPVFESHTTFLPPQQQQSSAAAALASLGSLTGLATGGGIKSPVDEYIGLMQSETVQDRIIDRFKLMQVYELKYRDQTRVALAHRSKIAADKKSGMITVQVEDTDPQRAAEMANQYVQELRAMTSTLAVSEAQQRRVFFENQLQATKVRLVAAQTALQASGFDAGAIKAEPHATAEAYAKARADLASAQVRLETMRGSMADTSPQVMQLSITVAALQRQVDSLERSGADASGSSPDYIGKYREFKYQETLFDLMAKQYELARADESREGALIQVVDPARPAERRIWPKRALITLGAAIGGTLLLGLIIALAARLRPAKP